MAQRVDTRGHRTLQGLVQESEIVEGSSGGKGGGGLSTIVIAFVRFLFVWYREIKLHFSKNHFILLFNNNELLEH